MIQLVSVANRINVLEIWYLGPRDWLFIGLLLILLSLVSWIFVAGDWFAKSATLATTADGVLHRFTQDVPFESALVKKGMIANADTSRNKDK